MKTVYMDYAATTYVKPEVLEEMMPYFTQKFGNPSSFYGISRETKMAIDKARGQVAKALNCDMNEVYFTGGGSESDNWAIKGIASAHRKKGNHIITTKIEHHAVLHTCEYLEKNGFEVTYLDVNEEGFIDLEELKNAITDKTILVSIMFANNEIGTIQPVKEIGAICRARRAGTENIASIVGLGKAIELATEDLEGHMKKLSVLRDKLIDGILERIPYSYLNGPRGDKRLPGNVNVRFTYIEGESILLSLDFEGICASSGSACTSGSLDPSHVLLAIGLPHELAHGSLRLTLGDGSTEEDVDYVLEVLPGIIQRIRNMSPLWSDFVKKGEK